MGKIKLELVNLHKEYGDLVAVKDLSLAVEEGETMALLGPSGCGKSTTLNMIVGLETPTSGDILIDGQSVASTPPGNRNVGLVFQDYAVFTNMSVRKNLGYGLKLRKMSPGAINDEVRRVADFLGLSNKLDRSPSELSASELQRVAIGRTLVTNPDILLLDEPLSNLEADDRNRMRRELRKIQGETGQTVIYVTHDQIEALSLAHRIAVMNLGELQQYDTAHNVYHHPNNQFVGSFLGNPPMNFVRGVLKQEGGKAVVENDGAQMPLPLTSLPVQPGSEVIVGMRPETMALAAENDPAAFSAEIFAIEPQGPETVLTARHGSAMLKVVVPANAPLADSGKISLMPHMELLALFDAQSGIRLTTDGGAA